jgi:uncharacterized membrane protein (GlpM family)
VTKNNDEKSKRLSQLLGCKREDSAEVDLREEVMDMMPRFLIGGIVVSLFAILGDVVKPESLGGVFAAAPTIALATLVLTMHKHGGMYVATEARSMLAGAIAFFAYACAVSFVLMRRRPKALTTAIALLPIWFATAAGLWALWLRK